MRPNLLALFLCPLITIAAGPSLASPQGQNQSSGSNSSSSSNSSSESSSNSPSKPNPEPSGKPSKTKNKKQQGVQTTVVDTDAPLPPDSAEKDIQVAEYYVRKGDPDAAIPRLQEAIQEKPNLAKPRLMLAEIYEKKGDAPDAVRSYRGYLQVFPTAPDSKKIEKKIEKLSAQ